MHVLMVHVGCCMGYTFWWSLACQLLRRNLYYYIRPYCRRPHYSGARFCLELTAINARCRNLHRPALLSPANRAAAVLAAPNLLSPHPKSPPTDLRHQRSDPASWTTSVESLLGGRPGHRAPPRGQPPRHARERQSDREGFYSGARPTSSRGSSRRTCASSRPARSGSSRSPPSGARRWTPPTTTPHSSVRPSRAASSPRAPLPSSPRTSQTSNTRTARERLCRVALVPLRRALKLLEVFISARAWESVRYTRVASVATKNYTDLFLKHDGGSPATGEPTEAAPGNRAGRGGGGRAPRRGSCR
jgi:hypothetical protein